MTGLLAAFALSYATAFSGAVVPGPLFAATVSETARKGFRTAPLFMAGHALLELALVVALMAGLAPLFAQKAFAVAVSLAGGAVMAWMGADMLLSLRKAGAAAGGREGGFRDGPLYFLYGAAISAANPYWYIWWATIGLGYMLAAGALGPAGIAAFFLGHVAGDATWYFALSFLVARGSRFVKGRGFKVLIGLCALCVLAFAGLFIVRGIGSL